MTTPRYVALVGLHGSGQRQRLAGLIARHSVPPLEIVVEDDMLLVARDPALPVRIGENRTEVTLGQAFASGAPGGAIRADPDSDWGPFVGIDRDPRTDAVRIHRPAFGTLPCYFLVQDDSVLLGSDTDDLLAISGRPAVIDVTFLIGFAAREQLRTVATGLLGVTELLGGQRMVAKGRYVDVEEVWSPWEFAAPTHQIPSSDAAVECLREVIRDCVARCAEPFARILLSLSGGLDSSIVAAALASAGASVTGLNLVTEDPAGDERRYARAVAELLDFRLEEQFEQIGLVDLRQSHAAHLPRPVARAFAQSGDAHHLELAREIGAEAFFGGGGGDNIFCSLQSAAPVVDHWRSTGPGRGPLTTAIDVSRLTHTRVSTVLGKAMRRAWANPAYPWPLDLRFLTPGATAQVSPSPSHPWLVPPEGALPGKAAHIALVMAFQNHMEGFARERVLPKVSPLMTRPVIETCLRIPTWMWCEGGMNRATARRAFSRSLPAQVLRRVSKATPGGFAASLFDANRALIRELLHDGLMAQSGLIDLDAVDQVLRATGPMRGLDHLRLLRLVDIEAWACSWTRPPRGLIQGQSVGHAG